MRYVFAIFLTTVFIFGSFSMSLSDESSNYDRPPVVKNSEDVRRDLEKMQKEMPPMFGNMVESMMQGKLKVFAQPETTTLLAKFVKNFYDDLIAEGFSKDEALRIVTAFGFPAIQ